MLTSTLGKPQFALEPIHTPIALTVFHRTPSLSTTKRHATAENDNATAITRPASVLPGIDSRL